MADQATDAPSPLRWLQQNGPTSTQLVGFATLLASVAVLLVLTGVTVTGTVAGAVVLGPLLLLTSPVWVPVAFVLFVVTAVALSACGLGVVALAGGSWLYRYARGRHPIGSDQVDYARSRIADTAVHVKDCAREYGGYLQSRVKDAAPGA